MAESKGPKSKPMSKRDLKKTRGGRGITPPPSGPIPIPYPNTGDKK